MKHRVIAVDDQPDNLLVIEDYLGKEYDVITFNRGQALVEYFEAGNKADLVLLDIILPDLDGFEVARQIRQMESPGDWTPIIFLSSLNKDKDIEEGIAAGGDAGEHRVIGADVLDLALHLL